jgi:hypothetical protein
MPHRRKKSLVDDRPPKRRGANRRKAKRDPTSELYQDLQDRIGESATPGEARQRLPSRASSIGDRTNSSAVAR